MYTTFRSSNMENFTNKQSSHFRPLLSNFLRTLSKINGETIWNSLFNLLCVTLCTVQLMNIVFSFFAFSMATKVKYLSPEWVKSPDIHVCLVLSHITSLETKFKEMNGLEGKNLTRFEYEDMLWESWTVAEMYNNAPNVTLADCLHRDAVGHNIIDGNATYCSKLFEIQKYLLQQYVCWRIKYITPGNYRTSFIIESLYYEQMLLETLLPDLLDDADKIRVTLTSAPLPYISRNYPLVVYKRAAVPVKLVITCELHTMIRLGFPYEPFECSEHLSEYFECLSKCKEKKSIVNLNMLPATSFYTKPRDYRLSSNFVFKNRSSDDMLNQWHTECEKECHRRSCHYSYCITKGQADYPLKTSNLQSSVRINLPNYPDLIIENIPQIGLLDCIIYVLSTLGTWFGIVLISCNPIHLYHKIFKPKHSNNQKIAIKYVTVTNINQ